MQDFETALTAWLAVAQKISDDYMQLNFPTLPKPTLTLQRLQKRIRVVRESSVHCFIDIETGDVLKADSWTRPAKGARGNIYDPKKPGVNHYGGLYRR